MSKVEKIVFWILVVLIAALVGYVLWHAFGPVAGWGR